MLIQQLLALKPEVKVDEEIVSERYDSSLDFDNDMSDLQKHLKDALAIMDSANWAKHMDDTESNFDVPGLRAAHDKLYAAIEEAINSADDFYDSMTEAS